MFGQYKAKEQVEILEKQAQELEKKAQEDKQYVAKADQAAARAALAKNRITEVPSHHPATVVVLYNGRCGR